MKLKQWVTMAIFLTFSVFQAFATDSPITNPSKEALPEKGNVISDSDASVKGGSAASNPTEAPNPLLDAIRQRKDAQQKSGVATKQNPPQGGENPFKALFEKNN